MAILDNDTVPSSGSAALLSATASTVASTSRLPPAAIAAIPKVELHCHVEGTMRASTARELAEEHRVTFPVDDPEDLYHYSDLTGFLDVFWLIQSVLGDREAWARLAYESVVDAAAHGLVYRESFFTPSRHLCSGHRLADIIAGLDEGFAQAESETGVVTRLIFDIDRDFGPQVGLQHVGELVELRQDGRRGTERIIGIGMDSTERNVEPATFLRSYRLAASAGLRLTAHQGENSPPAAIASAIDVLRCQRIDHGISVIEDERLTARLADIRMPFTVCPNANVRINPDVCANLSAHAFPRMRAAGLLVTLNTDDPGLTGLDLTQEYLLCAEAFGYDYGDLVGIALDGVEASWLDPVEKASLVARIEQATTSPTTK